MLFELSSLLKKLVEHPFELDLLSKADNFLIKYVIIII